MKRVQIGILILLGIAIGMILTASWDWTGESTAVESTTPEDTHALEALERTGRAFVSIAKVVTPAVVNISTERVIERREGMGDNPFHWFFDDDTFERFFQMPEQRRSRGLGSGVIISSDGYILTNNHVIREADKLTVRLSDEREFEAEIIGADEQTDLAVIRIKGDNLPTVEMGDSDQLEVGEWVVAIGNPFGLSETVTAGIVSAKGRNALGLAEYEDFIQTDAAINPGNSGGALVNIRGELIGINTAIETRSGGFQGVGFAIPINMANYIMEKLISHGEVTRGWLGVQIQDVEDDAMMEQFNLDSKDGVIVADLFPGNPASEAGMQRGDVIIRFDGKKITDTQQLRNIVAATQVGKDVEVVVMRDGDRETLTITLGKKPDDTSAIASVPEPTEDNLGMEVQELTDALASRLELEEENGVVVSSVEAGSPAGEAGIQVGDLILEIDRTQINGLNDYRQVIRNIQAGDDILFLVKRQNGTRFVVVNVPEN